MQSNPVVWFEIYVQDLARAQSFYEGVLAVKLSPLDSPDPNLTMMTFPMGQHLPGAAGALASMKGMPRPTGTGVIIYFTCEDCAIEAARVPAHGGKVMKEKFPIGPHGFIALVTDLDGNVIGLHSAK